MSKVFVLDRTKQPLNPIHPGHARMLLKQGKAAVYRRFPFTLILKHAIEQPMLHALRAKIDPGSQTTGFAIVNDVSGEVVWAAELTHRGKQIKRAIDKRRTIRRSRRQRKTRYRKPRFANRSSRLGMLPPSLESRVANILTWVRRLRSLCPITAISQEVVKFDLQKMDNPDIGGIEYCQGTLQGYEVRQYLLERWGRQCSYCGTNSVPLQIEHICPRVHGGTNRISNLCLACKACNLAKGTQDIAVFLANRPEVLKRILATSKIPRRDAAAVNTTRWALYKRLKRLGLTVEQGSGGLTQFNRQLQGLEKTHWLDAACVGQSTPQSLDVSGIVPLQIIAVGHGNRQMCRVDKYGFPRTGPKQHKRVKGFQTGDLVRAVVLEGRRAGTYTGKVAIRTSGSFNIMMSCGTVQGIAHRCCQLIARNDGYSYYQRKE